VVYVAYVFLLYGNVYTRRMIYISQSQMSFITVVLRPFSYSRLLGMKDNAFMGLYGANSFMRNSQNSLHMSCGVEPSES